MAKIGKRLTTRAIVDGNPDIKGAAKLELLKQNHEMMIAVNHLVPKIERFDLIIHAIERGEFDSSLEGLNGRSAEQWRQVIKIGVRARQKLMASNIKLVGKYVSKKRKVEGAIDTDDLMNEGVMGLARALEKFDVTRGYQFSTYAWNWIRSTVDRYCWEHCNPIRRPARYQNDMRKIVTASWEIRAKGENLTTDAIALKLGVSVKKVADTLAMGGYTLSMDYMATDDMSLEGFIGRSDDSAENQLFYESLNEAIATLPKKHQEVIRVRYLNDGAKPLSQKAAAKIIKRSSSTVVRIQNEAFEAIKYKLGIDSI